MHPNVDLLEPICALAPEHRDGLMDLARYESLSPRATISAQTERNWFVYLIEGAVKLKTRKHCEDIVVPSSRANKPLFDDPKLNQTAVVTDPCRVLRVDRSRFHQLETEHIVDSIVVNEAEMMPGEEALMRQLLADCRDRNITVPSIPESVSRFRAMAEVEACVSGPLSDMIERDPPIAGRLVAAANSALVSGRARISSVRDALVRLGLNQAFALVVSFAMKDLFEFRCAATRAKHKEIWNYSVMVSVFSRVLASRYTAGPVDREKAFMIGLLHQVGGMALLSYIDDMQPSLSPVTINHSLDRLTGFVTQLVLEEWSMDEDFLQASACTSRWDANGNPYVYLLNLARHQVNRIIGEAEHEPDLSEVLRTDCGLPQEADARGVLQILGDSAEVDALRHLLG